MKKIILLIIFIIISNSIYSSPPVPSIDVMIENNTSETIICEIEYNRLIHSRGYRGLRESIDLFSIEFNCNNEIIRRYIFDRINTLTLYPNVSKLNKYLKVFNFNLNSYDEIQDSKLIIMIINCFIKTITIKDLNGNILQSISNFNEKNIKNINNEYIIIINK